MKDKEQFGRVRNSLMKYLRVEYGNDVAVGLLGESIREKLKVISKIPYDHSSILNQFLAIRGCIIKRHT
ncbi:MAG TPA: hypothetical protein VGR54_08805 [Nitrosopumilaceae archaeon]|nr:hypothetical protein [Nitrosopumilaceae archaeon]